MDHHQLQLGTEGMCVCVGGGGGGGGGEGGMTLV